jgi:hypothetical protein
VVEVNLHELRERHRARISAAYRESAAEVSAAIEEHGGAMLEGFRLSPDELRAELHDVDFGALRCLGLVD